MSGTAVPVRRALGEVTVTTETRRTLAMMIGVPIQTGRFSPFHGFVYRCAAVQARRQSGAAKTVAQIRADFDFRWGYVFERTTIFYNINFCYFFYNFNYSSN